jgi:hypothetical protein
MALARPDQDSRTAIPVTMAWGPEPYGLSSASYILTALGRRSLARQGLLVG